MSQTRAEIEAHILSFMMSLPKGTDVIAAARDKWPDIPITVLASLEWLVLKEEEERWWESMEKFIEGEIITRALEQGGR